MRKDGRGHGDDNEPEGAFWRDTVAAAVVFLIVAASVIWAMEGRPQPW
jgi:hypothetical protein